MRCPNCNCIVDRGRPSEEEYQAYCFVCAKYVTIHNTVTLDDLKARKEALDTAFQEAETSEARKEALDKLIIVSARISILLEK